MSDAFNAEARLLETDQIIDLLELDTTQLTAVYGYSGAGDVYRWTTGALDYRIAGIMGNSGANTLAVSLPTFTVPNAAVPYYFQQELTNGTWSEPLHIIAFAQFAGFTQIGFDPPGLSEVPVSGTPWLISSTNSVYFGGIEYKSVPIQISGMEWQATGKAPRPRLAVSNIGGLPTALVIKFGDIVGARVTRLRTFKRFLDGESDADPSAIAEPEIFTVDRKSRHDKAAIEFELAPALDQQGIRLPRRLAMRDTCDHTYRKIVNFQFIMGTCPYVGVSFFKIDGSPTGDAALDVCGKHLSDCLLRFGPNRTLPIHAFPGLMEGNS